MSRISIPTVEQSLPAAQPLLAAVHKQLGVVPNLMKLVGNSPAALEGYLSLNGAMGKSGLSVQLRERMGALRDSHFISWLSRDGLPGWPRRQNGIPVRCG